MPRAAARPLPGRSCRTLGNMSKSVARGISGFASLLASSFASAQYAPVPGVRNSLLWVLLVPWLALIIGVAWSFAPKARLYRPRLLRPIIWSVGGLTCFIIVLFAILGITDGLVHEEIAFFTLYLILFSGPLAFIAALVGASFSWRARRQLRGQRR